MFNKKNALVPAALVLFCFLGVAAGNAEENEQNPCPYTVASLQGHYAVVTSYGDNLALALAQRYYDGKGNMTGTFLQNNPAPGSTTGARTIFTGTQMGTYTVNCDGSGVLKRSVKTSTGVVATFLDDFIITGAIKSHEGFLATNLADASEDPSATLAGAFVTRTCTRLPDVKPVEPAEDHDR